VLLSLAALLCLTGGSVNRKTDRGWARCKLANIEDQTLVFVIRIWFEPREIEGASPEWRGSIEHLGSGKRRYFTNLSDISNYIAPFLGEAGVEADE
jgi:hypothetical protein